MGKTIITFIFLSITFSAMSQNEKKAASGPYEMATFGNGCFWCTEAIFERIKGRLSSLLIVFGRVPMFFYVVHIYAIHLLAVILGVYQGFNLNQMTNDFENLPNDYGFGLGVTYALWIFLIVALYFLCKFYINFKRGKKHPFYSYL